MKTVQDKGGIRIDSVRAGEVTIDAISDPTGVARLSGKMAYVDSVTGERLGYCNRTTWSDETYAKLRELLESMEDDVLRQLFGDDASPSGLTLPLDPTGGVPSL